MEEAEYAEPVLYGNEDDIRILSDEISTLLTRFYCPAVVSFPHVEIQAVLTLNVEGSPLPLVLHLTWAFSVVVRLIHSVIRDNINGSLPAQFTYGLPPNLPSVIIFLFSPYCAISASLISLIGRSVRGAS